MSIEKQIVRNDIDVLTALKKLDELSGGILLLFVTNNNNELVGTLTDGDIRRFLIGGGSLNDSIELAMNKEYFFVRNEMSFEDIKYCRKEHILLTPCLNDNNRIIDIFNFNIHKSFLPIDAVMMAGGKGERLRPLTEHIPKPLLPIGDKAIIDYNVERLSSFGVKNIYVTVNYLREIIEEHFNRTINGVQVHCIREPQYLGTLGSIQYIESFCHDTILLMNSDLFTNIDYEDFFLHFKKNNAEMSVATIPYGVNIPYGIFEIDGHDIKGIKEKPTYNYYANAGIYLMKRSLLELVPRDTYYNATDLIEKLILLGKKVIRYPMTGYWIDIGKKEDYVKAQDFVKHLTL